jgi:hypothetical protein
MSFQLSLCRSQLMAHFLEFVAGYETGLRPDFGQGSLLVSFPVTLIIPLTHIPRQSQSSQMTTCNMFLLLSKAYIIALVQLHHHETDTCILPSRK